jgi:hypothetical protein
MQSARVKRVLTPVHNALYDHISSFGWCVRGDVTKEDFAAIYADRRHGEEMISGDYSSATDNIYSFAVECIVDVLSETPELTEEERNVLVGSFTNLRWVSRSGRQHPILRGSMMGNLVSFPLLCLLNKACYDICCDITFGPGSRRVGRFNGDDCAFAGTRKFLALWREVTGSYGLIVNEEKSGFDRYWLELNSQPYSCKRGYLVHKPVISFLRPFREEAGCLLTETLEGIKTFSARTRAYVLNVLMRHEISLREISFGNVSKKDLSFLLRKSWFRRALWLGPAPVVKSGSKRSVEVVVANPPVARLYRFVERCSAVLQKECVELWNGFEFPRDSGHGPTTFTIDRRSHRALDIQSGPTPTFPFLYEKSVLKWQFVWPAELYSWFSGRFPQYLLSDRACYKEWMDDHPFLVTTGGLSRVRPKLPYKNLYASFAPSFCRDYPLGYY